MRKDRVLPSCFLIFLLVLIVGAAIFPAGGTDTISGSVKFDPNRIDLDIAAPNVVKATIRLQDPPDLDAAYKYIDTSTILLEGTLPPESTKFIPGGLLAEFDGGMVINIIWGKIYHMDVVKPPVNIWLTITGNLNTTVGGTPFSVEGKIKASTGWTPPPP